jgi:hypothetical protein
MMPDRIGQLEHPLAYDVLQELAEGQKSNEAISRDLWQKYGTVILPVGDFFTNTLGVNDYLYMLRVGGFVEEVERDMYGEMVTCRLTEFGKKELAERKYIVRE